MTVRRAIALAIALFTLNACTPEQWIGFYFGPTGQGDKAHAVAVCESGLNPEAVSPDGSNHGLFQINNIHAARFEEVTGRPWADRYDAGANTLYAVWLWEQQGWRPWACA